MEEEKMNEGKRKEFYGNSYFILTYISLKVKFKII